MAPAAAERYSRSCACDAAPGAAFPEGEPLLLTVTIYHNPKCGTSRNVLAMIRERGEKPVVIEYLKTPPTREKLKQLIAAMAIPVRSLLRRKEAPYAALGLDDSNRTDDEILDAMVANPILIERPIVVAPRGVRLCRPKEGLNEILPQPRAQT